MGGLADLWGEALAGKRRDFLVLPGSRMSYAGLVEGVRRWLAWFDSAGIAPGERVVIRTIDEPAAIAGVIAALLDGVVPVLLTADTPDARLAGIVASAEPAGVVVDAEAGSAALAADLPVLALEPALSAKRGWFSRSPEAPMPGNLPAPAVRNPHLPGDAGGLAYILFTSGTTSAPTGVQVTRGNLLANLATETRLFGYTQDSRIFNDMVLAHADGLVQGPLQALYAGCSLIRSGGFTLPGIEQWLLRVRAERATHVITVPTVWAMIDRFAAHNDYFDAPECRWLMSVAAHLPSDLWQRLEARFGRPLANQYGLTETVVTHLWAGDHPEMGAPSTIGWPIDGQARLADPAPDGTGELELAGANVFPGYWRNPQRTAQAFTPDGWLRTGDLARLLPDGSYAYMGRCKTVIMAGGFLIRPEEIDEAMLRHPAVAESVTVALDDELFGEVPVTAVVLAGKADEAALTAHARQLLEAQKVPRRIVPLAAIPRGPSGKPVLAALRALLAGQHTPAAPVETADWRALVLAVAAEVFRVDPAVLDLATGPGAVPGWDSFSHLNFVLAVEQRFGVTIPAARVAAIATLADMVRTVEDLAA